MTLRKSFRWRGVQRLHVRGVRRPRARLQDRKKPCVNLQPHVYERLCRAAMSQGVELASMLAWLLRDLPRPRRYANQRAMEGRAR
jgi:macrodomain Ter protein organizer (MatP/YcbG family)